MNCFVELNNGYTIALQPIDKRFGAIDYVPYVLHSGDDRHGNSEEGEFLHAEMGNLKHIKRMVFYATIYSGASNWDQTDAVFTLNTPGHPTIEVPLNEHTTKFGENECVLCTVSVDGNRLSVERHVTFHRFRLIQHEGRTTSPMDVAYDFGMTWRYGSKD